MPRAAGAYRAIVTSLALRANKQQPPWSAGSVWRRSRLYALLAMDQLPSSDDDLSFAAELMLLAIDPAKGGFVPLKRRRFRKAIAAAFAAEHGGQRPSAWTARRARKRAISELEQAGLVRRSRPQGRLFIADRERAARPWHRLRSCLHGSNFPRPRDRELVLLLAWVGVLAHRLSKDERRMALRRLRGLIPRPSEADVGLASQEAAPPTQAGEYIPGAIYAVGAIGLLAGSGFADFLVDDASGFDFGESGAGDFGGSAFDSN